MIDTRLFSDDPETGIRRLFHFEDETEHVTIQTQQDIEPILEMNQYLRRQVDERANWKGDLHWVGQIPPTVYYDLKQRGILDDQKAFRKWLNDPDNICFRMRPGRV